MKIKKKLSNFNNLKDKFIVGLLVITVLLITGLLVKNQNLILGTKTEQVPIPTIEVPTNTPTPTPETTYKNQQNTNNYIPQYNQPTATPIQQPTVVQKVPVVLPHNGLTYYCDPSSARAVVDASNAIKTSTEEYIKCQSSQQNYSQTCSSSCPTVNICSDEMVRTSYGYSSYDDCLTKRQKEGLDCIDKCYNDGLAKLGQQVCNIGSSNATNSLNDLLNRYCR